MPDVIDFTKVDLIGLEILKAKLAYPVFQGPKGDRGTDGKIGKDGADGEDGSDGIPGEAGEDGSPGATGPSGPSGGGFDITATSNIAAFDVVISTGKTADSSNTGHFGKVIGVAPADIANGFSGSVAESGEITNPAWTWTAGDLLFLNGTSLSKIPPTTGWLQYIAIAKSPTVVVVELGMPISL